MIFLIFLLFSLGSLGRISFFNQEINIYTYEIVYAAYLSYLAAKYRQKPFTAHFETFKYLYWFLAAAVVTFIISLFRFEPFQNLVASLYLARLIFYLAGLPLIVHHFSQLKRRKSLITAMVLYIACTAAFSIVQYAFYPNLRNLEYLGWDPHHYRMFGTVFDTSTSSALYGLILIFLMFKGKEILKHPVLWLGSIILYSVIGALTYARGFYLAFTAALMYYLVVQNKKITSAFYLILIAVGLIILIPKPAGESANLTRVFTIQSRAADYDTGFKLFRGDPIFGVGYNHLRYVKPQQNNDTANHAASSLSSSFLIILSTMGIVGIITFVLMLVYLGKTSQIAMYSVLFLSIYSLSDNILLHPLVLFMETFIIAMGMKITSRTSP